MWNWTTRHQHPDERAIMLAALDPPDALEPSVNGHLAACDRCRTAVAEARALWNDARANAEADADAAFSEVVLDRQRTHILRRLEQHGHPARVIRFPVSALGRSGPRATTHRWVAAAAAAGLIVGVVTGRFLPNRAGAPAPRSASVATQPAPARALATPRAGEHGVEPEEAFLVDLEMAAASPRIEPLQALDAMTPRMSDGRR
jgi:hypothetical protein